MCVALVDREREILGQYESVLADLEHEVTEVRAIVNMLRRRLGVEPSAGVSSGRATYGGRPSLPVVILDVLVGGPLPFTDILKKVSRHPAYQDRNPPSRGSLQNRLSGMAERGDIQRIDKGVYALSSYEPKELSIDPRLGLGLESDGRTEPDDERTGTDHPGGSM